MDYVGHIHNVVRETYFLSPEQEIFGRKEAVTHFDSVKVPEGDLVLKIKEFITSYDRQILPTTPNYSV